MQDQEPENQINRRTRGPAPRPASEKRSKRVSVYFTDAEYADLLKRVQAPGDLSHYARHQMFAGKTPYRLVVPEINLKAYSELGRIASNINQIARKLNSADIIDLNALLDELGALRLALIAGPG